MFRLSQREANKLINKFQKDVLYDHTWISNDGSYMFRIETEHLGTVVVALDVTERSNIFIYVWCYSDIKKITKLYSCVAKSYGDINVGLKIAKLASHSR